MKNWLVQKPTHRTTQKHIEHYDATDTLEETVVQQFLKFKYVP